MSQITQDFKCKNPVTHAEAKRIIARQLEDRRQIARPQADRRELVLRTEWLPEQVFKR